MQNTRTVSNPEAKSSLGGMVWGCLAQGFYKSDWGILVYKQIQEARPNMQGAIFCSHSMADQWLTA